jgi:hypothetical protein
VIDTLHGIYRLSAKQKEKLQSAIASCLSNPLQVPAKLVVQVTGLITSMTLVTGPAASLFSRFLHRVLNERASWRSLLSLDGAALIELRFWQSS